FEGDQMYWQTYPTPNDYDFIKNYFWLDIDYNKIRRIISKDPQVKKAMSAMPNIRILRQPFDFTVLSFILSARNNIPAIRKSVRNLCGMLGKKLLVDDESIYLFPSTNKIANASIERLREAKVGYKAEYLKKTAQMLIERDLSKRIYNMDEKEARTELLRLPGVGDKISDCVLVFALGFQNLTPVDVWARRFLIDLYDLPESWNYEKLRGWIKKNFFGYASWADQFLFEWYRKEPRK
ncbi:MAG: DNA glycosylase, partial [Patescibacteria group bacterium]|nr:DNA glycosylase [Patescibacteria group bacterium]